MAPYTQCVERARNIRGSGRCIKGGNDPYGRLYVSRRYAGGRCTGPRDTPARARRYMNGRYQMLPASAGSTQRGCSHGDVVAEATAAFCRRFLLRGSPIASRMRAAARGRVRKPGAKTVERHPAARFPAEARSLLKAECTAFLRRYGLSQWSTGDRRLAPLRAFVRQPGASYERFRSYIEDCPSEIAANTLICLVEQIDAFQDSDSDM